MLPAPMLRYPGQQIETHYTSCPPERDSNIWNKFLTSSGEIARTESFFAALEHRLSAQGAFPELSMVAFDGFAGPENSNVHRGLNRYQYAQKKASYKLDSVLTVCNISSAPQQSADRWHMSESTEN